MYMYRYNVMELMMKILIRLHYFFSLQHGPISTRQPIPMSQVPPLTPSNPDPPLLYNCELQNNTFVYYNIHCMHVCVFLNTVHLEYLKVTISYKSMHTHHSQLISHLPGAQRVIPRQWILKRRYF